MDDTPLIFDIVRGSFVDGPGLRTAIFLKGCPLRCEWCHNPESHDLSREIIYHLSRCTRCGRCQEVCGAGAIDIKAGQIIDRSLCVKCGECCETCDSLALEAAGRYYSPDELREIILRDQEFYESSGGGVTFTGGEPLMHIKYLEDVMDRLKKAGVHIAIETCGYFDYRHFQKKILPLVDLILFDLKIIDPVLHKRFTKKNNELILDNFRRLQQEKKAAVIPRMPLVPGYTTAEKNITSLAEFLADNHFDCCEFLPYNPSGNGKWVAIGKDTSKNFSGLPLTREKELEIRKIFNRKIGVYANEKND